MSTVNRDGDTKVDRGRARARTRDDDGNEAEGQDRIDLGRGMMAMAQMSICEKGFVKSEWKTRWGSPWGVSRYGPREVGVVGGVREEGGGRKKGLCGCVMG